MTPRRPALIALVLCGLAAWFAVGVPAPSPTPSVESSELSGEGDEQIGAASPLIETDGLSPTDAGERRRRDEWVTRQVRDDDLESLPGWAGVWVDRRGSGRVTFYANDADTVFDLAAEDYPDWVDVRPVANSLQELETLRDEAESLIEDPGETSVDISIEFNMVVVTVAPRSADALMLLGHFQGDDRLIVQAR